MTRFVGLPNANVVEQGLADLAADRESAEALLLLIAAPRLRRLGIDLPDSSEDELELRLYEILLEREPLGAYSRYNALLSQIVSFAQALEREWGASQRNAP